MPKILITGSLGLIGSATAKHFLDKGYQVIGADNNQRKNFFGKQADSKKKSAFLFNYDHYSHQAIDIRDTKKLRKLFKQHNFKAIIHTAAQPSHDKATEIIFEDFSVNAISTVKLLELTKSHQPQASFVFTSTNKVYGDNPNKIELTKEKNKYIISDPEYLNGFNEELPVDQTLHSFFGASKLAADIYCQEYGRYLGLKTTILRLGCITGINHASTKLHGFLSFLIKSLFHHESYQIIGYQGKQVRDQLDASDVAQAIDQIIQTPNQGEVFNLGGGKHNSASILELIKIISHKLNIDPEISYQDRARKGDHICYYTDFNKFQKFYPDWSPLLDLNQIIDKLIAYEQNQT